MKINGFHFEGVETWKALITKSALCSVIVMGGSVKGHNKVQEDNTRCSPLIYLASHFIIEVYQVGQA